MTFDRLRFVPFLLWIVFFAFGVVATLNNPHREGSGFKGLHAEVAVANVGNASDFSALSLSKK